MRMNLKRLANLILSVMFLLSPSRLAMNAQETVPSEYQLKAAFLFHFAKFVEWPANAFPALNAPLIIGVFGDNPFAGDLERIIKTKSINGHPLELRRVNAPASWKNCHVLFIAPSEKKRVDEILKSVRGYSILTVSETDHFLQSGGMINFLIQDNKVRFEINNVAAKKAELKISSKLLSLATSVKNSSD